MDRDQKIRLVEELGDRQDWPALKRALAGMHPADIAEALARLDEDDIWRVFRLIAADQQPLVVAELEENLNINILEHFDSEKISEIMESLNPDDAADILLHFPERKSEEILALMEEKESEDVRELMQYDEDTAGGIMTTDFVSLPEHLTVAEALNRIAQLDEDEPFYYTYVVDSRDTLIGSIALWELIKERNKDMHLVDLVQRDFVAATLDMDQEECARLMSKYDLSSLPVIDSAGCLVGRIMVDDVIDVIEEEASEDIFRLAGSDDDELLYTSSFKSASLRLPWLLITLAAGFLTSLIMRKFVGLGDAVVLSAFVPIVMAMGGNTGIQSSTLVVRRLAMGTLDMSGLWGMLARELATGMMMGLLCGTVIGVWARFMLRWDGDSAGANPLLLSIVVAISLCTAMGAAALFGALTPMLLKHIKVDPAIASGPFVTASNDILALIIYYTITISLITL
jgi:magnesium transporter